MMELNIKLLGGRGASSFNNKSSINTISYKAMVRYVNTGKDSDFKDYIQLSNGNIIARAKNGTYSVIDGEAFIVDGEKIPANGKYMQFNSSLQEDLIKLSNKQFKKIRR